MKFIAGIALSGAAAGLLPFASTDDEQRRPDEVASLDDVAELLQQARQCSAQGDAAGVARWVAEALAALDQVQQHSRPTARQPVQRGRLVDLLGAAGGAGFEDWEGLDPRSISYVGRDGQNILAEHGVELVLSEAEDGGRVAQLKAGGLTLMECVGDDQTVVRYELDSPKDLEHLGRLKQIATDEKLLAVRTRDGRLHLVGRVPDGEPTVLGRMVQADPALRNDVVAIESEVPVLSDLPLLAELFANEEGGAELADESEVPILRDVPLVGRLFGNEATAEPVVGNEAEVQETDGRFAVVDEENGRVIALDADSMRILSSTPLRSSGPRRIAGRVCNEKGEVVAGAAVIVTDPRSGQAMARSRTDEDGRFRIEGLGTGQLELEFVIATDEDGRAEAQPLAVQDDLGAGYLITVEPRIGRHGNLDLEYRLIDPSVEARPTPTTEEQLLEAMQELRAELRGLREEIRELRSSLNRRRDLK